MSNRIGRSSRWPAWMRSDVHVSSRHPMFFVILIIVLALVSVCVEGVSEGWWN